jgi:hypothetical protein
MKTLKELAKEIQENPDKLHDLLNSFRTTSTEIRSFLFSLHDMPVYLVPALIETFALRYRSTDPKTLKDLIGVSYFLGALFTLCEDNTDWTYLGVSSSGKPLCRPINSELVIELDPDKAIKNVF